MHKQDSPCKGNPIFRRPLGWICPFRAESICWICFRGRCPRLRWSRLFSLIAKGKCYNKRGSHHSRKSTFYQCKSTTAPESSNTRIIARCDRKWERYFAYAIALRIASGSEYQIGPYRNNLLIRSKPTLSLRGRTS